MTHQTEQLDMCDHDATVIGDHAAMHSANKGEDLSEQLFWLKETADSIPITTIWHQTSHLREAEPAIALERLQC